MFESGVEKTVVVTAVVLWFATGWYLNTRLKEVHEKLDRLLEAFDDLRKEIWRLP